MITFVCCVCISISVGGIALSTPTKTTTTKAEPEEEETTTIPVPTTTTMAPTTTTIPVPTTTECRFNAIKYANMYPDLYAILGNDEGKLKKHYIEWGSSEKRSPCGIPNCIFDYSEYLINNTDVKNAGLTTEAQALGHYKEYGINENRLIRKC